jgi:hypothetical protein
MAYTLQRITKETAPAEEPIRHQEAIMSQEEILPISRTLEKPMASLFKVGGLALTIGFAGLVMMIIATFTSRQPQLPIFIIGCLLTLSCLAFFVYTNLHIRRVLRSVSENLPVVDALQRTAYQATELASVTQSFAFKHLEKIQLGIKIITPMIESLPVVGPAAKRAGLTDSTRVYSAIVSVTEGTKTTVLKLQEAIRKGDLKGIQEYGRELEEAVSSLKLALRSHPDA